MNSANTPNSGAGAVSAPLAENEHVKELLGILKDNGKDPTGLTALLSHVGEMESFVKLAENKIAEMKSQLDSMKEIQDHPIKHALQNAIKALEAKVAEVKAQIAELKGNIIEGCKNAVAAFKEKGASVLDRLSSFFNIKGGLQAINKNIDATIRIDDRAIAAIKNFSKEYHETGRHLKNMGRVLTGKPRIDAARESGKLAKAFSAPYRADRAIQIKLKGAVAAMIVKLEQLEQKTAAKREEKAAAPAEKKPSLAEKLNAHRERIKQKDLERPTPERVKAQGLEV